MTPLTELIITSGNADRILTARQLHRLLAGGDARRYGLVNRALKAGELLKARRGLYVLAQVYRKTPLHPFVLAQHLVSGSYVSAESALSFHGWIPEAVHSVLSVTPKGKSVTYTHELLGKFEFCRVTVNVGCFFQEIGRASCRERVSSLVLLSVVAV